MATPKLAYCTICTKSKRRSAFAPSELTKGGTRGRCRACNRLRKIKYKAAQLASLRAWERDHPERDKERRKLYRMAQPERQKAIQKRRKKRLKANGGSHTAAEWAELCARYGGMCLACGSVTEQLTKDHVIPIMQGGQDCIDNLQPLCASCNSRKGGKRIDYRLDWQEAETR